MINELPSALDAKLIARISESNPVILLDYDGTLTPIVAHPQLAVLGERTRRELECLAALCPVGIISGRDLDDVRSMVKIDGIWFAGSHGFDLLSPEGRSIQIGDKGDLDELLSLAARTLDKQIQQVPGAWVEHKRFAVAVHFRQTPDTYFHKLKTTVRDVASRQPGLRMSGGKKIFELRPDIDWDKGRAVKWVLDSIRANDDAERKGQISPVYIGDDETDEDALVAVRDAGIGIVVGRANRETAARYRLSNPHEVTDFLARLAVRLGGVGQKM